MKKGFTILELLVVIAIIGVLSSIILVSYNSQTDKARIAKALQWASGVNHLLGANVVGAWTFDNITGAIVNDDSGNNNNGTAYGGPLVKNGVVGKALQFDGANDYIDAGNPASIQFTNISPHSFSTWVKPLSLSDIYSILTYTAGPSLKGWYCGVGTYSGLGTNMAYCDYWNGSTYHRIVSSNNSIVVNQWNNIVYTYDGTNTLNGKRFYINGKEDNFYRYGSSVSSIDYSGCKLNIGARNGGSYFSGLIDDVRIYSATLTQAQIQQHYAEGLKTHQPLAQQ